jgi:phosphatidylserine decarboxylase
MKLRDYALMGLVYCLPRRGLSRLVRRVAQSTTLGTPVIKLFCTLYAINIAEAEETNIRAYPTFGAFFTRALKPGARPLGKKGVVSPADGCVSQCGAIEDNTIIQAKGQQVDVTQLLAGDAAYAKQFQNGTFITIYLSPRDYHRVHMPCDATQSASAYIPGSLFPVNTASAGLVPNLYARNERLLARWRIEVDGFHYTIGFSAQGAYRIIIQPQNCRHGTFSFRDGLLHQTCPFAHQFQCISK